MDKRFNSLSGEQAEIRARRYLKEHRYKILNTNFKNKIGEIDIIAEDNKVIVFVEVKYKDTSFFGLPREMVDVRKQYKIRQVAMSYINKYSLHDKAIRFDVIEILGDKITHIKDCF